jgi:anti-anti-sigma regulatory factor
MLAEVLDLAQATSLRDVMATLLRGDAVILDAGAVERMSTPCAQVLLAAARAAESAGLRFTISNASAAFQTAFADLGLQSEFDEWIR